MSVLIKGMKMPKNCDVCDFVVEFDEGPLGTHNYCGFPGNGVYVDDCIAARHTDCPLIEIPPHGRLIDEKDAIKSTWMVLKGLGYYGLGNTGLSKTVKAVFKTAPAIIEKEPEEEP